MTEHTTPAPAGTDDWWDRLYADEQPNPEPAPATRGRTVRVTGNSGRLPDWRTGQTIDLSTPDTSEDTGQDTQDTGTGQQDKGQDAKAGQDSPAPDNEGQDTQEDKHPSRSRPRLLFRKQDTPAPDNEGQDTGTTAPAPDKTSPKASDAPKPHTYLDDKRLRAIAFNGTAASAGYALGLVPVLGSFLPMAEQAVTNVAALLLATAGGYGAWKLTGLPYVRLVLPYPPISRAVITTITAEIGRRAAPLPVAWLNQHGTTWGLGPEAASLLLTAAGMCGGLWWAIDRRTRPWHWTARWLLRVPLASALLAVALYAPGPTS